MSRRLATLPPLVLLAALGACGTGTGAAAEGPLTEAGAEPAAILAAWVEVVCEGETVEESPDRGVALEASCPSSDSEVGRTSEARLIVYVDPQDARDYTSAEDAECDVPYSVVSGARWVSYHDDGFKADALLEAGDGTLICEGQ